MRGTLRAVNTFRALLVSFLIFAVPLSATGSMAAALSCPHQGTGALVAPLAKQAGAHDHAAMMAMHHDPSRSMSHASCDCVHHCAGASAALTFPAMTIESVAALSVAPAIYQSLHSDSSEHPLLRPPIPAPVA